MKSNTGRRLTEDQKCAILAALSAGETVRSVAQRHNTTERTVYRLKLAQISKRP